MLSKFFSLIDMEGREEYEAGGGAGGGKSGGGETQAPLPIRTTTSVGSALDATARTFEEESSDKTDAVDKKKMGTRGLQIPLASPTSDTNTPSGGVQV